MTPYFERTRNALRQLVRGESDRSAAAGEPGAPPAAIEWLDGLRSDASVTGKRFGSMLRELHRPDLLVAALKARAAARARTPAASPASADERHFLDFLGRFEPRMAQLAFGPEPENVQAIEAFGADLNAAAVFNRFTTEEHLKMLCLMTMAGLVADGTATPLKSELVWRVFVDTYNHLMKAYGDQVIDGPAIVKTPLFANRPAEITEQEIAAFLDGLPKRYLTLFEPSSVYEHVRLCRNMTASDVHLFLERGEVTGLTVVTLDKPFLFSNVCGVLSYLGADILQGQALTSTRGLVLDVFQVSDPGHAITEASLQPLLPDVVAGRVDIAEKLKEMRREVRLRPDAASSPLISFDHEASHQYTVIEIVAPDAPGLLYRISRALSAFQCEIDMVVISTEEGAAIDVFHVRKDGAKLTEDDELPLTELLERALEG